MRRLLLAITVLSAFGCTSDEGPQLPAAGEACDLEGQCAANLDCIHLVCADDRGPNIMLNLPEHMTIVDNVDTSLTAIAFVESANDGDQIEFIVDPGAANPHRELYPIDADSGGGLLTLPAPLAVGPHHLRARVVDGDGQPHANPSASTEHVLFVLDPDIPDTPQIAVVWPPSGYEHRIGSPLEIEIIVRPNSFTFVAEGDDCGPIPGCEPEFAPECEDQCGPVSRFGHVKLFTLPDYPGCLLDEPISCNGSYIDALRPDGDDVEVTNGYQLRASVPGERLGSEPGSVPLSVALSYDYHDPYPSAANVIYETITLKLVE
jgi:hypothetical protein